MVCIEVSDNICHGLTAGVHFKNFPHDGGGVWIKLNTLFAIHTKTQRHITACGKAFFSVDVHAPANLL
ncbi:MAG: hypothetical protein MR393_07505 [Intestinimonas massiliensis]|uniref:hypothetical protein n=1 Tax=Intestinimonas massiliensis (ex Afouda et al. 2020) TaxID=1673721 RepID=UPI00242ED8B8|nr:hypothetical protein [Intestinimonas massiliensis (ex Afouda et al. 2020)]MCI5562968.1 hypothetical protein [Intestinimonas massiliensis (ex Afouda et al. 2020)]